MNVKYNLYIMYLVRNNKNFKTTLKATKNENKLKIYSTKQK